MKYWPTVVDFIANGGKNIPVGTVIEFEGFTTPGDGGGAPWKKTATTGTASQTPVLLDKKSFNDSLGFQWDIVLDGNIIKPLQLGAIKGGESSAVFSLCFSIMRGILESDAESESVSIDGENAPYLISQSINATKLRGWNYHIRDFSLIGSCTGFAVIDAVGSRGGNMSNVHIYGKKDSMPSTPIQFARSSETGYGFCDNWLLSNVSTTGYYSKSGFFAYAQETTHYDHCRFWNYNHEARAAIFVGSDLNESITSLYTTPVTGSRSYINNKYTNLDCRYLPSGNSFAISSISKSNPAVVTTTANHSFNTGEKVSMIGIAGMVSLDNVSRTVTKISANSFSIDGIDSSLYGAFISGTAIKSQLKSSVLLSRCEQHTFDTSYIVGYGAPQLEIAFLDTNPIDQLKLDLLFEGGGMGSHVRFTGVDGFESTIKGFELETYNTHSGLALLSSDATTGLVSLDSGFIKINSEAKANLIVAFNPSAFKLNDINVKVPDSSVFVASQFNEYSGKVSDDSGKIIYYGVEFSGVVANTYDFTPTVTAQSGAYGAYTVTSSKVTNVSGMTHFSCDITITDIGTGTGFTLVSCPSKITPVIALAGKELIITGKAIIAQKSATAALQVRFADNTTITASGSRIVFSGLY